MILDEVVKRYEISLEKLEQYVEDGFIRVSQTQDGLKDYNQEDFEQLGLIRTLLDIGLPPEKVKMYLRQEKEAGMSDVQIRTLRKQRYELLEEIHRLQQLLDQVDYMILQKKSKK